MLVVDKVSLTYNCCRCIMTSGVVNKNYFAREGKFMKKLMREDAPKKKWHMSRPGRLQQTFSVDTAKLVSPHVTRRVQVLNKLFMTHITDLMTTGEVSSHLVNRGIEISHVKLANDFKVVRVYWFSFESDPNKLTETTKKLEDISFKLRHELSQLKVIGVVPPIIFVKDKAVAANVELEKRILEADYGEDYSPMVRVSPVKPELTLFTKLPEDLRKKVLDAGEEVQGEEGEEDDLYVVDLPPMKQNVLGLNHLIIMSRVKQALNKVRAVETSKKDWVPLDFQQKFNPENIKMSQNSEEMRAFDDFLLKRKIEEKRRDRWELRSLDTDIIDNPQETDDYEDVYEHDEYVETFDDTNFQENQQ